MARHKRPKETDWLTIIWKGKMVEINGKGKIRSKKC
jgi:hypothetical protein